MLTNREKKCVHAFNTNGLITDWSFENVNANVMPYGISLDVSAPPKTKINKW